MQIVTPRTSPLPSSIAGVHSKTHRMNVLRSLSEHGDDHGCFARVDPRVTYYVP